MFKLGRSAYWSSPVRGILKAGPFTQHRCLVTHNACLLDELATRGLIAGITRPEKLKDALAIPQSIYLGIDPTASSLHAGHLLPLVCLLHFQMRGHTVIPLIGGATGLVGDPSGRAIERKLTDTHVIDENVAGLKESVEKFFDRAIGYVEKRYPQCRGTLIQPRILNNLDWLSNLNLLDFLRTVGVSARVNTMLGRDSVQLRMESKQGISYTEFTYQLLQAYDFYKLHTLHGCNIQLGGSDQWGNVIAGLELINRLGDAISEHNRDREETAFGITTPLLTTASGEKFGKTAGNAVWLDDRLTSAFDFYQFFLRTTDLDVERYLKMFTLTPVTTIHGVMQSHLSSPEKRVAQRFLADELTELVHTEHGLHRARIVTKILFDSDYSKLKAGDVISALADDPRLVFVDDQQLFASSLTRLAATHKLTSSYAAARKLAKAGGLYLNNSPIRDPFLEASRTDLLNDRMIVLRAGRDQHLILMLR